MNPTIIETDDKLQIYHKRPADGLRRSSKKGMPHMPVSLLLFLLTEYSLKQLYALFRYFVYKWVCRAFYELSNLAAKRAILVMRFDGTFKCARGKWIRYSSSWFRGKSLLCVFDEGDVFFFTKATDNKSPLCCSCQKKNHKKMLAPNTRRTATYLCITMGASGYLPGISPAPPISDIRRALKISLNMPEVDEIYLEVWKWFSNQTSSKCARPGWPSMRHQMRSSKQSAVRAWPR